MRPTRYGMHRAYSHAMNESEEETKTETDSETETRHINGVDATTGHPIVERVMAHKLALETLLATLPDDNGQTRGDIELALSTINELLTGDLTNVPRVVASDMSRWLERNKHLAGD